MSLRQERIAQQEADERDDRRHDRPNISPRPLSARDPRGPHYWPCPARLGRPHNISMRRPGGGFACWYCAKTTAMLKAEAQTSEAA